MIVARSVCEWEDVKQFFFLKINHLAMWRVLGNIGVICEFVYAILVERLMSTEDRPCHGTKWSENIKFLCGGHHLI